MSDIVIDKEGTWHYRGMEMSRRDIVALFYRHLLRDESGRFFIEIGNQRCQVDVEDAAYAVRAVRRGGKAPGSEDSIYLLLSDDSIEELNPASLRIGKDSIPYCGIKNDRFEARFSSPGYYQLAEYIDYDPERDEYFLSLKGQRHYITNVQDAEE